jgi:tRNA dimethylallyltransferase
MFNVLDVEQTASVSAYRARVLPIIERALTEAKTVILVGGSGLYVRAALDQMDFPPTDSELRAGLYRELESLGVEVLFERLKKLSPDTANQLSLTNSRKIIRALEVIELTGEPPRLELTAPQYLRPTQQIASEISQDQLFERIATRTQKMLERGLVEEVEQLRARLGPTAKKAIGYAETLQFLTGEIDREQLEALINLHTQQLVKRQLTWFRKDTRIKWRALI